MAASFDFESPDFFTTGTVLRPSRFAGLANYAALDSTGRAQARRFYDTFEPWTREERARFRREVANARVVELHGAHHYLFMSHEADVIREMRAFLEGR